MLKFIMLMCLLLLFTAYIDGGIIKDDMDNTKPAEVPATGSISGRALYYKNSKDNTGITVKLKPNDANRKPHSDSYTTRAIHLKAGIQKRTAAGKK